MKTFDWHTRVQIIRLFVKNFNLKKITLKTVRDSYNSQEAFRDSYNRREAFRDSSNCWEQFSDICGDIIWIKNIGLKLG